MLPGTAADWGDVEPSVAAAPDERTKLIKTVQKAFLIKLLQTKQHAGVTLTMADLDHAG